MDTLQDNGLGTLYSADKKKTRTERPKLVLRA